MNRSTNARILVVGGDSHFSYLMRRYVRTSAHQIVYANIFDDVMMIAQREQPVAIILEVDHPGSTGWHTLRSLKMNDITGKIPVIVCSWLDEKDRCLEEGVDVYLRMPILYEDFEKALSHMGILPCE